MKAVGLLWVCYTSLFLSNSVLAAALPSLQSSLVNHYTFDHPLGGDANSSVEVDLGTDQTNIHLINGAPRVTDSAWGASTYALQTGQNSDFFSNDDWKAGIQFISSAESTLVGTKHVTGITLMGWFKPLGDRFNNPNPNTNTPDSGDEFNSFGLFGLLRGDEDLVDTNGHSVRALLEVINNHITGLGRRLDKQSGSGSVRSQQRWDLVMVPGQWTHLTATFDFDMGEVDLYKNGLSIETENLTTGNWQLTSAVDYTSDVAAGGIKIGGSYPDNTLEFNPFNGLIDELMAFNMQLSPTQVLAQYQLVSGLPGDLDGDQDVDGADFLQVQRGNLQLLSSWQEQFGIGIDSRSGVTTSTEIRAVPEPTTLSLIVLAFGFLPSGRSAFRNASGKDHVSISGRGYKLRDSLRVLWFQQTKLVSLMASL